MDDIALLQPANSIVVTGNSHCRITRDSDGGEWSLIDPIAQGRVQVLQVGRSSASQAQAVVAELKRMAKLDPDWDWWSCAVVARK